MLGLGPVVFFFQAEDGIRDLTVTGVQTCALPICRVGRPESIAVHQHLDVGSEDGRLSTATQSVNDDVTLAVIIALPAAGKLFHVKNPWGKILKLDESCISNPKSEIFNWTALNPEPSASPI